MVTTIILILGGEFLAVLAILLPGTKEVIEQKAKVTRVLTVIRA